MKLTIFAATGGIGRQILQQAVAAGHDVMAVVRNPKKPSGATVAHLMLRVLGQPETIEQTVGIANR